MTTNKKAKKVSKQEVAENRRNRREDLAGIGTNWRDVARAACGVRESRRQVTQRLYARGFGSAEIAARLHVARRQVVRWLATKGGAWRPNDDTD